MVTDPEREVDNELLVKALIGLPTSRSDGLKSNLTARFGNGLQMFLDMLQAGMPAQMRADMDPSGGRGLPLRHRAAQHYQHAVCVDPDRAATRRVWR